ncbi:MAG TPA: glycosyltransferase family 39 protein [Sphingomicrobium sp.]|nr:glycosyltransferase family 39 protein [Sphingomicrobium sp.]
MEAGAANNNKWIAPLALILAIAWIIWLNPVGFVGGGADDLEYMKAVRCWVAAGEPCLAHNHWATRWPIIAPIALVTGVLGESRTTIALAPLAYACASLALVVMIGDRLFGRPAGYIAAIALILTPAYAIQTLEPAADGIELAWLLASFAAALLAYDKSSRNWALGSGIALGIAAQTRDTSLAMFPIAIAAIFMVPRDRRRPMLWLVPGMILPMALEALTYWVVAGDPLWRVRLSLGHTHIISAELPEGFDTSQSPLFNPHYIAAWKREAGINWFWPLDPWLNLLAGFRVGLNLVAAILLGLLFTRRFLDPRSRRLLVLIVGAALLYSWVLIYALAIDPKSRMFFVLAAASSLAIGVLVARAWRGDGRQGVVAIGAVIIPFASLIVAIQAQTRSSEHAAAAWIRQYPGQIEVDPSSRNYLLLVKGLDGLPDRGSGKPLLIAKAPYTCDEFARPDPQQPAKGILVAKQQMGGIKSVNRLTISEMCLLRYAPGYRPAANP